MSGGGNLKGDSPAARKALETRDPNIRLYLLHGPDNAGSEALAARFAAAMGADAERIDLDGPSLGRDPARLPDEAAAISMFAASRWIRVQPAGDEVLAAAEALLEAPVKGDPVVLIAGNLRKNAKLLALCDKHPAALCIISYGLDARSGEPVTLAMARERGLILTPELARRLIALTGGERGLLTGEIEKLALYVDATPEAPREASAEALDALSAEGGEQHLFKAAAIILSGNIDAARHELTRQRQSGGSLAGLLRITLQRAVTLSQTQAGVNARYGGRDEADLQARWTGATLRRAIARLADAERTSRLSRGVGETVMAQELLTVARQAARGR